eukprot:TRINITY_DN24828_c0_g1_i1.p1 TRINITY_DN24828_c0_g1~~TRINITY_DN24828_c0_g1_i1.p1  ORF type:complete len:352 (+),score=98.21 TRINITY_DN24828_c0_g1_i1:63-1058(+)
MGYYNQPVNKLPTELNELEKLLRALQLDGAIEALDLLETITRNVIQNASEDKYRRLRTTNEKLKPLFGQPGVLPAMQEMGWQEEGEFMVLPKAVKLDFPQHVVKILEAKSHYGKLRESEKRTAKLAEDPNKAAMLKQLELDRRERSAGQEQVPVSVPAAAPAAGAAPVPDTSEEEQIQAAIKLSLQEGSQQAAAQPAQAANSPAKPVAASGAGPKKPQSAFDFKRREDPEKKREEAENTLQDLRAIQKAKFKEFQADPNAKNSEAYQRPAAIGPGGKKEEGWFDWMWGGSSSSSSGGGGGGGGGGYGGRRDDRKPRMKTIGDLPKPPRGGG